GGEGLVGFGVAGGLYRLLPRRQSAAMVLLIGATLALMLTTGWAQNSGSDQFAKRATEETHLAYVITGDAEVDNISRAGLAGLTLYLAQRTALEAGDPVGLDLMRDELAFFPLIYWPISPNA